MNEQVKERKAFLKLCGERDKRLISGEEKMKFMDFDRLTYLTDYLGFKFFNLEIWNKHVHQFREKFDMLEKIMNDSEYPTCDEIVEDTIELYELWIRDFYYDAPNKSAKMKIEELIEKRDFMAMTEVLEQTDTL